VTPPPPAAEPEDSAAAEPADAETPAAEPTTDEPTAVAGEDPADDVQAAAEPATAVVTDPGEDAADSQSPAESPAAADAPAGAGVSASVTLDEANEIQPAAEPAGVVVTETLDAGSDAEPGQAALGRKRPSTAMLAVGALLLGPLVGGALGYVIQAARPATPLPALKVAAPRYPATTLDAKAAADAKPKPLPIDGDLRKLLLAKPDGFDDWDNFGLGDNSGWFSVGERARAFGNADTEFKQMLGDGFRRDAVASWKKGDVKYRVELIQFGADDTSSAITLATDFYVTDKQPLPGTVDGFVSTPAKSYTYAQSTETYYMGLALARRGNVVLRIEVFAPSQVNADELKDIAKRQWERLA
jgi:hypothetical protein